MVKFNLLFWCALNDLNWTVRDWKINWKFVFFDKRLSCRVPHTCELVAVFVASSESRAVVAHLQPKPNARYQYTQTQPQAHTQTHEQCKAKQKAQAIWLCACGRPDCADYQSVVHPREPNTVIADRVGHTHNIVLHRHEVSNASATERDGEQSKCVCLCDCTVLFIYSRVCVQERAIAHKTERAKTNCKQRHRILFAYAHEAYV